MREFLDQFIARVDVYGRQGGRKSARRVDLYGQIPEFTRIDVASLTG